MSEYEVTQGNDRRGWMFCGAPDLVARFQTTRVACRMLSDLGLHERVGTTVPLGVTYDLSVERDMAHGLLSACIVYEGAQLHPQVCHGYCAARMPGIGGSFSMSKCMGDSLHPDGPDITCPEVLNDRFITDTDKNASLRELYEKIEAWHDGLPAPLMYDDSHLTDIDLPGYGLHSQYCKVQIFLHQGLRRGSPNARKRTHAQIADDSAAPQSISDGSDDIIYQYALRIARLVVTYREVFGLEEIPSIILDNAVVSATVMIQYLNKTNNTNEVHHRSLWLRQLVRSLESMQLHYPIITRMLDSLRQICGSGPLKSIFQSRRKEASPGGAPHGTKTFTSSSSLLPQDCSSFHFNTSMAPPNPLITGFVVDA
ncbi:unnamed protein product [Clonostachys rosea]|uniref:Transcription factor domain-containing protein n=1 Tax=Bionectria ochroleuca TaxID=29856 RepID=A0ABY6TZX4_BIOOC|nr:unnamed protein product [Clonostachys rosea]